MRNKISAILFLLFASSFIPLFASSKTRLVRIPFYENDALYKTRGNDGTASYISEFLENVNRYLDYDFEYVPVSRDQVLDALKDGRIDMIPFLGRDADVGHNFLLSDTPTAIGSLVFASNRIVDFDNPRIGILKFAPENLRENIMLYAEDQEINASYFFYDSTEELLSDLYANKIDVFATIDFTIPDDFFVLAIIDNQFFSLAVNSKNQDLFNDFNSSLSTLFLLNPNLISTLRSRYIPSARYSINKLSPKEQKYVRMNKNLRVASVINDPPYSSLVNEEFRGIIIDQIEAITNESGLTVSYIPANSYIDAVNLVKWGEADVVYEVNELLIKEDLASIKPTSPLLSQKYVVVCNDAELLQGDSVFVCLKGRQYSKAYLDKNFHVIESCDLDTLEECFEAIEENKNYFTLMPLQEADYYFKNHLFTNIKILNDGYSVSVSLGLSRRLAPELAAVLDKSIYTLTTSMFEDFMQRNMELNQTLGAFIKKHLALFCIIVAVFILVLATAIFLIIIILTKRRKDRQIQYAMNLANRDSMTGLFNHIAFEKKVAGILSHQQDNEIGVFVMIDIDNFKKVNDTLGHAKGDYVIVSVANILLATFRGGDLKGRMGGDEFAVFMRNVSDIEAVKHKMRVFQIAIKDYFEKSGLEINVTCSIGISWCRGKQGENAFKKIYKAADEGL
ncbi:MAG: diguanylate cyclase, partial [Treponema sp.]|nr:diguanylate cyclase [Treponema sp.]